MNTCRVILDTNIIVSALLSPMGNPAKIYRMIFTGAVSLFYSTDIFEEYQDVLYRTHLRIPADDMKMVFAAIRQHGKKIEPVPCTIPTVDKDDRFFYDTAKSADAYLITGN